MKRLLLLPLLLLLAATAASAQNPSAAKRIAYNTTLPATCDPSAGDVYVKIGITPTEQYLCTATNTWTRLTTKTELDAHTGNTSNPHSVTKAQVGLGSVTDDAQLKIASNLSDLANVSTARTNLGVAIGTNVQAHDATLTALAAFNSNGLLTQTTADTFVARTITGTTNQVNVSNGNGVAGNPTLSLPQSIATTSTPTFGGMTVNASQPVFNFEVTGTTGKGRLTSLVGNWFGMTANVSFNGTNWVADDITLPSWIFKLDARNNTALDRFEVGRIAAGGTPAGSYTSHLAVTGAGSVVLTSGSVSTSATDGFVYIPTVAGTPTGTPTSQTGRAPLVYDTTNNKLCIYAGGIWRCATF